MNLRWVGVKRSTGIDGYEPDLAEARRLKTHDELILEMCRNLITISIQANSTRSWLWT